eukprot:gene19129-21760_t
MALSAISEALCGPTPRMRDESPALLQSKIMNSARGATSLDSLVRDRPLSAFSPMFVALFSPEYYRVLLLTCGFADPDQLLLPRPSGARTSPTTLQAYHDVAELMATSTWLAGVYALSAHVVSVCGSTLSGISASVVSTRLHAGTFHEADARRLNGELLLFEAITDNARSTLDALKQYHTYSQHPVLLSRDAVVSICSEGMLRLMTTWVTGTAHPRSTPWSTLADFTAASSASLIAPPSIFSAEDPDALWYVMHLPIESARAWFLRHPCRDLFYDAQSFLDASPGVQWQFIVGLAYALNLLIAPEPLSLAADSVLRFCIAYVGGVREPTFDSPVSFDAEHVLIAPPNSLSDLLDPPPSGDFSTPSLMLHPPVFLRTPCQRTTALTLGAPSLQVCSVRRYNLLRTSTTPSLGEQPLRSTIELCAYTTWEMHTELQAVEDTCRKAYQHFANRHRLISARALLAPPTADGRKRPRPSRRSPTSSPPAQPSTPPSPVPAIHPGAPVDFSSATGLLASLLRYPSPSDSVRESILSTWRLLPSLNWTETVGRQLALHVRRCSSPPQIGEFIVVPAVSPAPSHTLSWYELFSHPQAVYRVHSLGNTHFTATLFGSFHEPAGVAPTAWPTTLSELPNPDMEYPERLVLRAPPPMAGAVPSGATLPPTDAPDDSAGSRPQPRHLPSVSQPPVQPLPDNPFSPQNRDPRSSSRSRSGHRDHRYPSGSDSSSDGESSTSSGPFLSPSRKHRPISMHDAAGNTVVYTKSSTLNQVKETTSFRALSGGDVWLNRIFRDTGNYLNNYNIDCIVLGAIAVWRESLRSLPHCSLSTALLHPAVSTVVWFVYRHTYKDIATKIIYFDWAEFHALTPSSIRLAHLLEQLPARNSTDVGAAKRICVHSLCHTYKLPLKARGDTPAGVPGRCNADCPYLHAQDFPAGTTKASLLSRIQRTVEKIMEKTHAEEFTAKLKSDSRFA